MNYMGNVVPLAVQAAHERYDENHREMVSMELAEEDWDAFMRGDKTVYTEAVADYIGDVAGDYLAEIVRGGEVGERALRLLRTDCCNYRAAMMRDSDRVQDNL